MKGSMCKVCGHEHWLRDPHIGLPPAKPERRRSAAPAAVAKPEHVAAQRALNVEATRRLEAMSAGKGKVKHEHKEKVIKQSAEHLGLAGGSAPRAAAAAAKPKPKRAPPARKRAKKGKKK